MISGRSMERSGRSVRNAAESAGGVPRRRNGRDSCFLSCTHSQSPCRNVVCNLNIPIPVRATRCAPVVTTRRARAKWLRVRIYGNRLQPNPFRRVQGNVRVASNRIRSRERRIEIGLPFWHSAACGSNTGEPDSLSKWQSLEFPIRMRPHLSKTGTVPIVIEA